VRELRQNLSRYLAGVRRGRHFEVTERGEPVALLVPLSDHATPLAKLVAAGRASEPQTDLLRLGPPHGQPSRAASEALHRSRAERL
jgi:prevent-host-death family protein